MTFFSRCDSPEHLEPGARSPAARRSRTRNQGSGMLAVVAGFAEDIGILFRYAAGLDYYGRDRHEKNH